MPRIAQNRRAFALHDLKALDDTHGTFSGYLACFGNEDLGGDIIEQGAFAKTLNDARERKAAQNSNYLFPILYQHNDAQPCGGFVDAHEDAHGLYVKGQLDLDTQLGRDTYSGLKKGYLSGLSIGYSAIKHKWVGDTRHLQELALFEGSVVTFPMNPAAQVSAVKSASGKADWPLGERDAAWDNGAAHKRIVAWATSDSGDVDTDKLKSVHFYSPDGDAAQNISEYKLLFCDVVDGDVKAMPKGIFACAGSHGVDNTTGISDDDKAAIRNKISAYYKKMAKAFDDDSIVAPWDANKDVTTARMVKGSGGEIAVSADGTHAAYTGTHTHSHKAMGDQGGDTQHEHSHTHDGNADHGHGHNEKGAPMHATRKARDFNTAFQSLAQSDQLQDDWGDTWQAIVTALWDVMNQAYSQANYPYPDMETIDPVEAAQANLDAFSAAVIDLVKRSVAANFVPMLDDDGDSFLDPDGPNADDDACYVGSMSADLAADVKAYRQRKAGRTISAENHAMMSKALDMIGQGHQMMSAFVKDNDPKNSGDEPPQQSDNVYDPGFGKSQRPPSLYHYANARAGARPARSQATTARKAAGAGNGQQPQATTHSGRDTSTDDADIARFRALMADMRRSVQERAPVA